MGRVGIILAAGAGLAAFALAAARVGERPGALSGWQALALGAVQGATELLPISSSGHLILVPWLADWTYLRESAAFNKTFDVALHLGTLAAVLLYFRAEVALLLRAFVRSLARRTARAPDERLAWVVAIGTIPAVVVGGLAQSAIEDHLGEPWQIAVLLAFFALVLYAVDRRPSERSLAHLGYRHALALGFAQALALAPGVSRSGIVISAARLLGLDRDAAARVSFLLLIPVVFGASVLKGAEVAREGLPPGSAGPFLVGMLAAAASGLAAISALLGYVRRHTYGLFVLYRLLAAAVVLVVIATGAREATM
jgi:undecaprenyl-diphosphatase